MAEQLVEEITTTQIGGQDASKAPYLVPENSYFAGVNLNLDKGILRPRWGLDRQKISFDDSGLTIPISNTFIAYKEIFSSGRFQMLAPYTSGANKYLVIVINGIIFFLNSVTKAVSIIPITDGSTLNENAARLNWTLAEKYLVIYDFPNRPVIIEGNVAHRSDASIYEVPVSTIGAYNQNRLFIGNAGNEFTAGDPTGNLATPFAPITFEEVLAPASSYFRQFFQLPTNETHQPLTAMLTLQLTDTSTGIGPLLVATSDVIYSYNSNLVRSSWQANTFGTAFVINAGIAGPRAVVNVGSDIWFMSGDGQVRTAAMSREEQKRLSKIPVSREVDNWLKYWDKSLVSYTCMGYFNNKIFASANPYRVQALNNKRQPIYDVAFGGFVVIGLDSQATLNDQQPPEWDGLWTGVRPMDTAIQDGNFYVMGKDDGGTNQLYKFNTETTYDTDGSDIREPEVTIYSREYDFKTSFRNKSISSIDLGLRNIKGDFSLDLSYKPAHSAFFVPWRTIYKNVPWRSCGIPRECLVNGFSGQTPFNLTIGDPYTSNDCELSNNTSYGVFRKVQLKFVVKGIYWELEEYRLKALLLPQDERNTEDCLLAPPISLCKQCNNDWAVGPFKSCQSQVT